MTRKPVTIIGVDSGLATCGMCRIHCYGDRIEATGLIVVRTSLDKRYKASVDEDRRLRVIGNDLGVLVAAGDRPDIIGYETYRPHKNSGEWETGNGRKVAMAVGVVQGYGQAIGALTMPIDPAEPKRLLGAHSKEAVSRVLEAKIDGLTELLDSAGRAGFHGSDAAAVAYAVMVKIFKAQTQKRR